jgi:catechol 2,3-dioxygenase-like lactoylglutathione lyase family enzyme
MRLFRVIVPVPDIDAAARFYETLLRLPGKQDDPIAVQPWGERSFYLRDPYGNRLCMVDQRTLFTG